MDKVVSTPQEAIAGISDGMSLSVGGFGLCGIPSVLIAAIHDAGLSDLEVVSNNCGVDDWGLGILLRDKRIRRMVSSYVGENKEFERQYLSGELEVELTPQGTLAERLRAGGAGIPAFFTSTGVGTAGRRRRPPLALRRRRQRRGRLPAEGDPRVRVDGRDQDVRARAGDHARLRPRPRVEGRPPRQPRLHQSARNFNPICAMAGKVTIAEVEELVEPGELDPDHVHTPGIFVQRVLPSRRAAPRSASSAAPSARAAATQTEQEA